MNVSDQPMRVKCFRCGYEWWTKSRLILVTCPSCGSKTQIREKPKRIKVLKQ